MFDGEGWRDLIEVLGRDVSIEMLAERLGDLAALDLGNLLTVGANERFAAPIPRPGVFLCVGLNYADHAREAGMEAPSEPILFMKAPNSISGPADEVRMPRGSAKLDWEVELGVVIGRRADGVSRDDALDHVLGYCVVNDLSARDWQLEGTGQWVKGKSFPGAGPVGPWVVTRDDIPDPGALRIGLQVDGEDRQSGSTATMIFDVPTLVAEASKYMTLEPGDLIATGTPPGVGMGMSPPLYLAEGQTVRAWVEGLGEQSVTIVA